MSLVATFNVPTKTDCPPGNIYQILTQYLQSNVTITITDTGGATVNQYSQGSTPTPTAGAVWYRQNSDAFRPYPLGIYGVYNGRWVPQYPPPVGRIDWFNLDPTGLMDANGFGLFAPTPDTPNIAGILFGYQLCNNKNGAVNLQNRFPRAGYQYSEGTGWVANVLDPAPATTYSDQTNGGRGGVTLLTNELPSLNAAEYKAGSNQSTPMFYGGGSYDPATIQSVNPATGTQIAIQPLDPLYRVIGAFQFVGYGATTS